VTSFGGFRHADFLNSGRGSVWLERLVWDQEVTGSSPVAPTLVVRFRFFVKKQSLPLI
jgi:hypothetical protein